MKNLFSGMKKIFIREEEEEFDDGKEQEYVELDTSLEEENKKMLVKTVNLTDFADVKPILQDLREGNVITILNIKPLKDKDMIEMKRAVNKIKKTVEAVEGDIAGFNEDYIIITPSQAEIYRNTSAPQPQNKQEQQEDDDDLDLI